MPLTACYVLEKIQMRVTSFIKVKSVTEEVYSALSGVAFYKVCVSLPDTTAWFVNSCCGYGHSENVKWYVLIILKAVIIRA